MIVCLAPGESRAPPLKIRLDQSSIFANLNLYREVRRIKYGATGLFVVSLSSVCSALSPGTAQRFMFVFLKPQRTHFFCDQWDELR